MGLTYFYRDLSTLKLVVDKTIQHYNDSGSINIWDAGCSRGAEPYTLAIILREKLGKTAFGNVKIHATDLDPTGEFESIISNGIYPAEEIQRVPVDIQKKYFEDQGSTYLICDEIKESITFKRHNLLTLKPIKTGFNLVLCKNVLLHFNASQRRDVLTMFHESLLDKGFFAIEQTQSIPSLLAHLFMKITAQTQIFQKK